MSASTPFDEASSSPIAHLDAEGRRAHLLVEHLASVGRLAGEFASCFSSGEVAAVAGRLHDLGKYADAFQRRIRTENGFTAHIEGDSSGPRDHSTAGAILAKQLEQLHPDVRAALAFVIAGHHAGLGNVQELQRRLAQKHLLDAALDRGYTKADAAQERAERPGWLPAPKTPESKRRLELWVRMIFSCLCDADFLDTERFYDVRRSRLREAWPELGELSTRLTAFVDGLQSSSTESEVNRVRAAIRAVVLRSTTLPSGFFALTVPTGGGKTLVAMEFALRHALAHGGRRVIVAVPLTAILEQNAEVYRRALGDDAVLEHHSAVDSDDPRRETPRTRVASENWDAPVVVTTTVQLFESLFANRTSRARKLHNVAGSVVVLDEAQALPVHLLECILDGLKTLVRDYGVTVVFSTATQPAFIRRPRFPLGIETMVELVPPELDCFRRLKRVRVEWPADEVLSYEALAGRIAEHDDVLAIVHRRADARALAAMVDERSRSATMHLSALLCPAHRTQVLGELRSLRSRGAPVRVVATQLIEAGVDVDFPVVYRALGGLDAIAQAAGRCNREGRRSEGILNLFHASTPPPPGLPTSALGVTRSLLREGPLSIDSPDDFRRFFESLYPTQDLDALQLLVARSELKFRDVGNSFRMVQDEWSAPVVVPWGDAQQLRGRLLAEGAHRELYRRLQRLTINVPRRALERWLAVGIANEVEGVAFVEPGALPYDERFGLRIDLEGQRPASELYIDD